MSGRGGGWGYEIVKSGGGGRGKKVGGAERETPTRGHEIPTDSI